MLSQYFKNPLNISLLTVSWTIGGLFLINYLQSKRIREKQSIVILLGDVGGTNIRFELIIINPLDHESYDVMKKQVYQVANHDTFQSSIQQFLKESNMQPNIAVISIAGLVSDNSVYMGNVLKWGVMNGKQLAENLKIKYFMFVNDFQAASYGILQLPDGEFVSINGKNVQKHKVRGVIGPGTGLGSSILFMAPSHRSQTAHVLAFNSGYIDAPFIDLQTQQYYSFYKKAVNKQHVQFERLFCGPSLPFILRFYSQKFPNQIQSANLLQDSKQIMQKCLQENPPLLFSKTFDLFLKIYSAAIGNFICHHMCTGGLYLVGELTNSFLKKIKGKDILKEWKERHPQIVRTVESVPIIVCKQTDLGLKGALFIAISIISSQSQQINEL